MMDRRHRVAALVTIVFASFLAGCANGSVTSASPPGPAPSVKPVAAITVVIRNFAYLPANFTVPRGATVTVRNEDQELHTLTADNQAFNTGNVPDGLPATFQAPMQPGRYPFHCLHHPYMTGTLTVS